MIFSRINFPIYGIIIILSVLIGMLYVYFSLKKENYTDKNIRLYFFLYITFSFVLGKLFTQITNPNTKNFFEAGLSAYGGLVGVLLAAYTFEKILPTDNKIIKYSIISLPLIYGLTKIACFIVGCCYGIPYNGIFSVTYTDGLNKPLFPIQIVETIVFLVIFYICNKQRNNKNIIYITIVLVSIFKFLLDFLRYDHVTKIITVNQIFSIMLLIGTIIVFLINKNVVRGEKK
ncbi:MAG: prolipoprotein diacylglyceryl transferase [Bacilli bacterium]|nr:prolipoprotein diacylglyceryl transferase [Bacilli bacterium]